LTTVKALKIASSLRGIAMAEIIEWLGIKIASSSRLRGTPRNDGLLKVVQVIIDTGILIEDTVIARSEATKQS